VAALPAGARGMRRQAESTCSSLTVSMQHPDLGRSVRQ
jgi:hypothetical protein